MRGAYLSPWGRRQGEQRDILKMINWLLHNFTENYYDFLLFYNFYLLFRYGSNNPTTNVFARNAHGGSVFVSWNYCITGVTFWWIWKTEMWKQFNKTDIDAEQYRKLSFSTPRFNQILNFSTTCNYSNKLISFYLCT